LLWEYLRPPAPGGGPGGGGGGGIKRNIALYGDKVYAATADGHVIALDAKTGKIAWDKQVADTKQRYGLSAGPMIVKGKVIQGITSCGGIQPGGCYIVALDANTGQDVWRFNTLARPGDPG